MKRSFVLIALVALVAVGWHVVFAQQQQSQPSQQYQQPMGGGGMGPGMMQGGTMGRGMGRGMMPGGAGPMGGPGCRGCAAALGALAHESVTATSDGGVVVAVAGKLIKYNSSLNKVAETTIDIDWAQVHQRMQQIMQNCPMRQRQRMQQEPPTSVWQGQPNP
jgi:hypothetical protein